MQNEQDLIISIRERAGRKILFLPHAVRQMSRPDRMISPAEIRDIVADGEIIEEYPDDPRGLSCLISGKGDGGRPIHVVCTPKEDYLAIITAYVPILDNWEEGFSRRKK